MAPTNVLNQSEFQLAYTMPDCVIPKINAPSEAPITEP